MRRRTAFSRAEAVWRWLGSLDAAQLRAAATFVVAQDNVPRIGREPMRCPLGRRSQAQRCRALCDFRGPSVNDATRDDELRLHLCHLHLTLEAAGIEWETTERRSLEKTCTLAIDAYLTPRNAAKFSWVGRQRESYENMVRAVRLFDTHGEDAFDLLCVLAVPNTGKLAQRHTFDEMIHAVSVALGVDCRVEAVA